ncbi:unnamed protein product [Meloidogyne enterolobii]|uniref:Uncharacterized protein n=1 Tax=Meloidogyne enterolobii TaxID=390850 RepID=A0ACB1B9D6_MELEN
MHVFLLLDCSHLVDYLMLGHESVLLKFLYFFRVQEILLFVYLLL